MPSVVVLGATGSIGRSAADVLAANKDIYHVHTIAACNNIAELVRQCDLLSPENVITASKEKFPELQRGIGSRANTFWGMDAMIEAVGSDDVDMVLCSIIGISGIEPVLAALKAGKHVALASKEVLVLAGELVMKAVAESPGGRIVPVDSEHSGVFQSLMGRSNDEVRKIWLTVSGGPFRNLDKKITVDSASMMNNALELIEAKYLFNLTPDQLDVVINPQSIVHALVELSDGSMIAQMSVPDMRLAIAYGLSYPQRLTEPGSSLNLAEVGKLEFFAPDRNKFPSLEFADAALRTGGTLPAVMNAANEVAVERFCAGEIKFSGIWKIVGKVMESVAVEPQKDLAQILEADAEARARAKEICG